MKEYNKKELKQLTDKQLRIIVGAGASGDYKKLVCEVLFERAGEE